MKPQPEADHVPRPRPQARHIIDNCYHEGEKSIDEAFFMNQEEAKQVTLSPHSDIPSRPRPANLTFCQSTHLVCHFAVGLSHIDPISVNKCVDFNGRDVV